MNHNCSAMRAFMQSTQRRVGKQLKSLTMRLAASKSRGRGHSRPSSSYLSLHLAMDVTLGLEFDMNAILSVRQVSSQFYSELVKVNSTVSTPPPLPNVKHARLGNHFVVAIASPGKSTI